MSGPHLKLPSGGTPLHSSSADRRSCSASSRAREPPPHLELATASPLAGALRSNPPHLPLLMSSRPSPADATNSHHLPPPAASLETTAMNPIGGPPPSPITVRHPTDGDASTSTSPPHRRIPSDSSTAAPCRHSSRPVSSTTVVVLRRSFTSSHPGPFHRKPDPTLSPPTQPTTAGELPAVRSGAHPRQTAFPLRRSSRFTPRAASAGGAPTSSAPPPRASSPFVHRGDDITTDDSEPTLILSGKTIIARASPLPPHRPANPLQFGCWNTDIAPLN